MRDLAVHESGAVIDLAAPLPQHVALLRQMLAERDVNRHMRKGVLRCYLHDVPMYLQLRAGVLLACHWHGSGLGAHQVAVMSAEHRTQVEYVARAADRAGLDTAFEVALSSRVRPDLVVADTTAVEVQRSHLTVRQAKLRTTKAVKGGMALSLWLSDRDPKYAPKWMYQVPSATAFARDWHHLPPLGSATLTSGLRNLVPEPCRPPYRTQCPERAGRWCGKWHLAHQPMTGVSLDALTVGVATGEYVPAVVRRSIILASEKEVRRYGVAWQPPATPPKTTERSVGRDRYECRAPGAAVALHEAVIVTGALGDPSDACCGEHPPGRAGEPLVLACRLCPNSPTYWRRTK